MNKTILGLGLSLGLLAAPAIAGVYVVEDAAGDMPIVIVKDDPALADTGEPHRGFSYATRYVTAEPDCGCIAVTSNLAALSPSMTGRTSTFFMSSTAPGPL